MIARLTGKLIDKSPAEAIIETGGVGYRAFITLQTYYALPDDGADASLHIHTHVKEDAIQLYGFITSGEQEIFNKLIGVNKVGPKLAITILSGIPYDELAEAIGEGNVLKLSSIPGVGKKTAERLILELADKLVGLVESADTDGSGKRTTQVDDSAVEALMSLGYKKPEATKAVIAAHTADPDGELETIVKEALRQLAG